MTNPTPMTREQAWETVQEALKAQRASVAFGPGDVIREVLEQLAPEPDADLDRIFGPDKAQAALAALAELEAALRYALGMLNAGDGAAYDVRPILEAALPDTEGPE